MTRDAIETQQRPPWWRPQQHTPFACLLRYGSFFSLSFQCPCLFLQNNKKWWYISFLQCMKEKFNFSFHFCSLSRTVTTKTINVNKYDAQHLKVLFSLSPGQKPYFRSFLMQWPVWRKIAMCWRTVGYLLLKEMAGSVYRYGNQAIWIYLFQSLNESSAEK